MRYYYDCEFIEDGRTIELISIGIVAEDGREYYAVNSGMPWKKIERHSWLMKHVVPYLPQQADSHPLDLDWSHPLMKWKTTIAREVLEFLIVGSSEPELWAWYASYDHVVLAQLWGRMIDMPRRIPMYTNDIRQEHYRLGSPVMPEQGADEHNALADALHNKVMYEFLKNHERRN